MILTFIGITALAQGAPKKSNFSPMLVNDTSFVRIVNGIIVNNEYKINAYSSVEYIRDESEFPRLGIKTTKPIMLINVEGYKIEDQVDSVLYSDPKFMSRFIYPLHYQLPIVLNGELVSLENKDRLLSNVSLDKIEKIQYKTSKESKVSLNKTPFGIINVILQKLRSKI